MILKVALTSGFFDFPKSSQLNETQGVSVRNLGGKEEDEGKPGNSRIRDKRSRLVIGKGEGPKGSCRRKMAAVLTIGFPQKGQNETHKLLT